MAAKAMTFTITEQGSGDAHVFLNIFIDASPWSIDGISQNPIVLDRQAMAGELDSINCVAKRVIREYLIENPKSFAEQKTDIEAMSITVRD